MCYRTTPRKIVTDAALDALGNPVRRAMLQRLAAGRLSVGEIAAELPISRPAVSRHLSVLKNAELVTDSASGTSRHYSLNEAGFAALRLWLDEFWTDAEARFRLVAENTGDEVRPEND
jgi:DNA-binding transcriptional ArsR family regulator